MTSQSSVERPQGKAVSANHAVFHPSARFTALRGAAHIAVLLLLVGAAWSCRRSPERNAPPLSTPSAGPRFVAVAASHGAQALAVSGNAQVASAPGSAQASACNAQASACNAQASAGNAQASAGSAQASAGNAQASAGNAQASAVFGDAGTMALASDGKPRLRIALEEQTWTFQDPKFGRIDVVVVLPDRYADEKFPMLVALHGRGEAMKGPERGARGWVDDYALLRAMQRLGKPPLSSRDFEGFVAPKRLATLNQALEREPYRGLVVLCPYTPDLLAGDKPFEYARPYAQFLVETLLPRARRDLPVLGTAETTGIDGVSLGGRVGFLSGLYAAEHFHSVAGLQAAFDSDDAVALGRLGDDAFRRNRGIRFRLLTSDRDYFIEANQTIAAEFESRRLPIHFLLVPGPHDYVFNRGPGSIEMLFFHDRALRRNAWPE